MNRSSSPTPSSSSSASPNFLTSLPDQLISLITTYQSLNSSFIPTLTTSPSSISFLREYVSLNRPVLFKSQGKKLKIPALDLWKDEKYLCEKMNGKMVEVAVSPDGNADSIVVNPDDGQEYFVEPASQKMTLETLFSHLHLPSSQKSKTPVYYLQSQNNNLGTTGEFSDLIDDVGKDGPEFASEAFGGPPEAVNIWIGDSRSVTSLHKDPFENIYLVIKGSKTFTLLPPIEYPCLDESNYPHATYQFNSSIQSFRILPTSPPPTSTSSSNSTPTESITIPWISTDPSNLPTLSSSNPFSRYARPLRIVVEEGDLLYLPSLWFHKVEQFGSSSSSSKQNTSSENGGNEQKETNEVDDLVIAVNWWYDMKMEGSQWSLNEFIKGVSKIAQAQERS